MADGEACGALMLKQQEEALRGDVRRPVPARLFRSTSVLPQTTALDVWAVGGRWFAKFEDRNEEGRTSVLPQTTALDVWAAVGGRWFAKFEGCVQAYVEGKK